MSVNRIADRYAKTLLEAAQEKGVLDESFAGFTQLKELIEDNRELSVFLSSPVIESDKKKGALLAIIGDNSDEISKSFLSLVCDKGRASVLIDIIDAFCDQYRTRKEITKVRVISASELGEASLESIKQEIQHLKGVRKKIELDHKVQPDLIGGFIIQFDDKIYDASVSHQISTLRNKIAH
jgi:F-type H+-transporting ATPase subunit delta